MTLNIIYIPMSLEFYISSFDLTDLFPELKFLYTTANVTKKFLQYSQARVMVSQCHSPSPCSCQETEQIVTKCVQARHVEIISKSELFQINHQQSMLATALCQQLILRVFMEVWKTQSYVFT